MVQPSQGANINVSMAWLRNNVKLSNSGENNNSTTLGTLQELELRVYRGTALMGTSAKKNAGKQMVYFPSSSDTQYTIRVTKASQNTENVRYAYAWSATDIYHTENRLDVGVTTWYPLPSGGSKTVPVNVNEPWTVVSNATSWLTVSPSSGSGNGSFTMYAAENTTATPRNGIVTVSAGSRKAYIIVEQEGKAVSIETVQILYEAKVGTLVFAYIEYSEKVANPQNTYVWEKYNGSTWIPISGANLIYYIPVAEDANSYLRVTVTGIGTNVTGKITADQVWVGAGSVSITSVAITGSPRVGSTLTANVTYSGSITNPQVTYRWEKWNNSTWVPISGATSATYTPVATDLYSYIQVTVTGTGTNVTGSRTSNYVYIETGAVTIVSVTITGTPKVGSVLTASVAYSGSITNPGVTYKWEKWNGTAWVAISGAVSASYTPVAADANSNIRVTVAGNGANVEGSKTSDPVLIENGLVSITAVAITGTLKVGSTLTASVTYSGSVTNPQVTYKWEKFSGSAWVPISGATSATYTPVAADANSYIQVTVTGTGANVTGTKTSGYVYIETGPVTVDLVVITGTPRVGSVLTVNVAYSGSITNPGVAYKWEKWNGMAWVIISGATSASYTPVAADANSYIQVTVTGTGTNVTGYKTSNPVFIEAGLVSISSVAITGTPRVGNVLTANVTYSGSVANPQVTYRWEKWNGSAWAAISGATSASYTPVAADAGTYIQVTVTGTGTNVTGSKTSSIVLIETSTVVSIISVAITGTPKVGSVLTANVTYSGSVANPQVTYRWEKWNGSAWKIGRASCRERVSCSV
jgi:hypothetical protein